VLGNKSEVGSWKKGIRLKVVRLLGRREEEVPSSFFRLTTHDSLNQEPGISSSLLELGTRNLELVSCMILKEYDLLAC